MRTSRSSRYHHAEHGKARLCITALCLLLFPFTVFAANTPYSIEGHTVKKNDRPVFFVGDTVWTAGVRFHDEEMDRYLADAKSKGFNLIGVFGTPGWALRKGGNINGDPPFNDANPTNLNHDYWSHHRTLISKAKSKGITVFLCIGHPLEKRTSWFALSDQQAYDYGYALGETFRDLNDNILWTLGQDSRAGNPDHYAGISLSRLRNCAEGITDGVQGARNRDGVAEYWRTFMTFHCQGPQVTSEFYHSEPWLDVNALQTQWGNARICDTKNKAYGMLVGLINKAYSKSPYKPVLNLEACYENHTHATGPCPGELKEAWHMRLEAFWGLLSGQAGHVYGGDGLWDAKSTSASSGFFTPMSYSQGIKEDGRDDMRWVRAAADSINIADLVPCQAMVNDPRSPDTDKDYICAARSKNNDWAMIYTTDGRDMSLNMDQIACSNVKAYWYNPRNGKWYANGSESSTKLPFASGIRSGEGAADHTFDPPGGSGEDCDWLLIFEELDCPSTSEHNAATATDMHAQNLERPDICQIRAEKLARERRHIMNCDNGHVKYHYPDELKPGDPVDPKKLLSWRFLGHEQTQVDAISLSTTGGGLGRYTHRTEVGEIADDIVIVKNLLAQGTDHMEIISKWCREHDIEFFWSMRMNDTHDAWGEKNVSELKKNLQGCLLGTRKRKPAHGHWTALDYGQDKVRDLVYRLVEEVCTNYELDGLELDFWRYPVLFRTVAEGSKAGDSERAALTDLMRRIRTTADRIALQRGEAILIAVRVPDSIGYCRDMGIDLEAWLESGLIDILIPGGDFQLNEWEYSVKLGHRHGVKVYPSLEVSRLGGTHKASKSTPQRLMRQSLPGYGARAANVFNAGADGIHSFNMSWKEPSNEMFQVLASPETLRTADKLYFANYLAREWRAAFYLPEGDRHIAIERLNPDAPCELNHRRIEQVRVYFGEDLDRLRHDDPVIAVHLEVAGIKDSAEVVTKLNGKVLENGMIESEALEHSLLPHMTRGSELKDLFRILEDRVRYPVSSSMLRNGLNSFEIRSAHENNQLLLNDLFISVTHGRR